MALRDAILAALLDGEASGYDLAKAFDASVANFWSTSPQQLYKELEKLESDGLIEARVVHQDRRPTKRMVSLTDAGRAHLRSYTAKPAKPAVIRDDLLVHVQCLDAGSTGDVRASILVRRADAERRLRRYHRMRDVLLGDLTEEQYLASDARLGPYLTLARGISFEEENLRWIEFALTALDGRTGG